MSDYISREAVLIEAEKVSLRDRNYRTYGNVVRSIPAADVAPVRHGRWIKDDETGEPICSVCHSGKPTRAVCSSVIEHKLNNHEIRYCYYCGARMDGGQDDV